MIKSQIKKLTMVNAGASHTDELPSRNKAIPHTAHGCLLCIKWCDWFS